MAALYSLMKPMGLVTVFTLNAKKHFQHKKSTKPYIFIQKYLKKKTDI